MTQVKFEGFQAHPKLHEQPFKVAVPSVWGIDEHKMQASFNLSKRNP